MTNKEAIEILKRGYPDINEYAASEYEQYYDDVRDYDEALDLAIKAIETMEYIEKRYILVEKSPKEKI